MNVLVKNHAYLRYHYYVGDFHKANTIRSESSTAISLDALNAKEPIRPLAMILQAEGMEILGGG